MDSTLLLCLKSGIGMLLFGLSFWTLFGNLLVLLALKKYEKLRTVPNLLIGNLAFSDFLLSLTVLPLSGINDLLGHWVFGVILCNIWLSIDVLCCTASIWSLVAIAFDRFTATLFPIWYRDQRKFRRFTLYSVLVWGLSVLICLPPLVGFDGTKFIDPALKFRQSLKLADNVSGVYVCELFSEKNYVLYSALGSFIIPLVCMTVLYARIFVVLQKRAKILRNNQQRLSSRLPAEREGWRAGDRQNLQVEMVSLCPDSDLTPSSSGKNTRLLANKARKARRNSCSAGRADLREQRATKRMLIIIVIFVACWLPFTCMYLIRGLTTDELGLNSSVTTPDYLLSSTSVSQDSELNTDYSSHSTTAHSRGFNILATIFVIWLGYFNSALNPVLYTIFNKDYRQAFARLLNCKNSRNRLL